MAAKEDFFKIYSSIPLKERKNAVVVIEEQPISWILASQEIKNNTPQGKKILQILKELRII